MSAARTLPVTPAERACATVLRAYLAWNVDANPEPITVATGFMLRLGDFLAKEGVAVEDVGEATPAGAALLARVEAAERPTYARAKALLDALNKDGGGFVVNGMLHAAIIAEANAKDAPRVEAAPALDPTAAIVAFIATEEARYRRNSKDPAHDAAGRERCANKASVLATVAAYIERGDHLAPPIDAPPAKEPG